MSSKRDAFFAKPAAKRKRPGARNGDAGTSGSKFRKPVKSSKPPTKKRRRDEELDSEHTDSDNDDAGGNIDDLDLRESDIDENASGEEFEGETPAQKRLRLAKLYLETVRNDLGDGEVDAADIDRELIASRLRQDVLQHAGKIHLFLSDSLPLDARPPSFRAKGHRLPITSAIVSESGITLFTAGKEGSISKWDLLNGKRLATLPKVRPAKPLDRKGKGKMTADAHAASETKGHTDEVLALALSSDGKYLASGGRDRRLAVWDAETHTWIRSFGGHRDIISALSFRKGTHQLYTGSFDRTLKSFDLGAMGYVETLFGHQDPVTAIDSLRGETAISAGGQDRTVRYWKIVDETQLVFRGGGRSKMRDLLEGGIDGGLDEDAAPVSKKVEGFVEGRIDCVAMLDETTFVSGGDSGSISLWSTTKKKPLFSHPAAHGIDDHILDPTINSKLQNPRWITSIAALPYSDLFASGSWDGSIRIWKLEKSLRSFSLLRTISVPGVINSLQLVRPPPGALSSASWLAPATSRLPTSSDPSSMFEDNEDDVAEPSVPNPARVQDILLAVGVGQEPRLGRWFQLKGNGVKNCTFVFALTRRGAAVPDEDDLTTLDGEVLEGTMDES